MPPISSESSGKVHNEAKSVGVLHTPYLPLLEAAPMCFQMSPRRERMTSMRLRMSRTREDVTSRRVEVNPRRIEITPRRIGMVSRRVDVTPTRLGIVQTRLEIAKCRLFLGGANRVGSQIKIGFRPFLSATFSLPPMTGGTRPVFGGTLPDAGGRLPHAFFSACLGWHFVAAVFIWRPSLMKPSSSRHRNRSKHCDGML